MNTDDIHAEMAGLDPSLQNKWQRLLDLCIEAIGVPLALVVRATSEGTEILLRSGDESELFHPGEEYPKNSGMCFEAVLESKKSFALEDALHDERWKAHQDVAAGFVAFLGVPLIGETGEVYGAICLMDTRSRPFSELNKTLLSEFAGVMQDDLLRCALETERKSIVEELGQCRLAIAEAEAHFQNAFQSSPVGLVISSLKNGKIIDVNQGYHDILGYSEEETIGKSAIELNLYWDPADRKAILDQLLRGEFIRSHEMLMRAKNGERKTVLASLQSTILAGNDCLITSIYDITSLRNLEYDSALLYERYLLATRAAQAGIWDWDIVSNTLVWDNQMYQIYDASKEEFGGAYEAWLARIHPDDFEKADQESRLAQSGKKEYNTEFRIHVSDGSVRYIKAYGDVIRDANGNPLRMVGVNFDITGRKKLEQDLIESEQKYKDLFNQNSAVRIVIDVDSGDLYDVNPAACSFYGYTREQMLGMNVTAINGMPIHEVLSILKSAYLKKRNYFQAKHKLANGERRDVEIFNGPIEINQRRFINCIVHDITERKRTEEKLIASEARYREIFDRNSVAQLLVNSDTLAIVDANPAALNYYGYSIDEIRTKSLWDINVSGESSISGKLGQTFAKGSNHFVTQHRRADQTVRDVEVFNGVIFVDGKKMIHAIIYDITESSKAILDLVESERRFRQLIENAPDGIVVETGGQFAYANQKAVELLHASNVQDLVGTSIVDCFKQHDRNRIHSALLELNEGKKARMLCEETMKRLDGEPVDVELSAVPFRYNEKNGALIYLRDRTERREFERAKEEMEWQLRQKQKLESIGTLAGGVAHEINNPINGIINYAELIAGGAVSAEQITSFSQGIIHEGKRIAEIVKNLLSFARQEKQTHSPAQIQDIIDHSVSLMRVMLRRDQIALELDIPDGLPSIKCRSQQIQQVIMNLITNARDALNAKYVGYHEKKIIRIDCQMVQRDGRRWFRITVMDNGTGIPAEIMERIFDPFFTTKPRDEGTGLGLSISHGIVKDHHGELYFETEPGEFTKAILVLPIDNGWSIPDVD